MGTSLAEKVQQTMATLAPNRFFFISPYRSLTTSRCFARFGKPAVSGNSLDSPFQQKPAALLADAKAQGIENPVVVGVIPLDPHRSSSLHILESWQPFFRQERQTSARRFTRSQSLNMVERQAIPERTTFEQVVARVAALTATPQVDEMVLSRLIDITTDTATGNGVLLRRLTAQGPVSYDLHVPLADGDVLLGTSPKLLLRKDGERFSSILLADSARRQSDEVLGRGAGNCLLALEKDYHEHEPVTQAMKEVLCERDSELHAPSSPQPTIMSMLWHPATPFEGKTNSRENALTLACLLHPTPVLNGFPHQVMTQVTAELEPFGRELFGGIVGWCDSEDNDERVVAIRCAKLREDQVRLFAGARIMPMPSPLGEWREIGVEPSTILNVFKLY